MTDLRMADWFRFPTREEDGVVYVEVPVSQARADTQLKWVRFGHYRTDLSSTLPPSVPERSPHDKRLFAFDEPASIPEVYLIPKSEWDRVEMAEIDARWDQADHEDIIARAREINSR
ncbi:MAG: hypothetical protein R3E12_03980 [Candidatus Eisenbacteria bacterium]|uniref:Uncharacterized protein n=1 Tax=Eiseniibacteriota bacterium TaxID=2212470 RepID=A0A956RQV7_UNCEI|nr:hypothetical protein [Candidatus Eisenbacteria bacterium]